MLQDPDTLAPSTRVIYATFDYLDARKFALLAWLAILAIAAFLLSGIYIVKKEEQAVLTRFGKVVNSEVQPGIHYALPLVEKAHIRKVMRIMLQNVATKDESGGTLFTLLSGDTNLFEADISLQYKINNLRAWLYATTDPESILTLVVREQLIGVMGSNFIDLIFTNNRDIIQDQLYTDVSSWLADANIGIELLALNIVDLRPIEETVAAFRDVSDAIAESNQMVSNARRRTERQLAHSRGQAESILWQAKARAEERKMQASASAEAFMDLLDAYRGQPASVIVTRYWHRMRTILKDATVSTFGPGDSAVIDINMLEGMIPGVGAVPGVPAPAKPDKDSLAGAQGWLTTANEQSTHGFENVEQDRLTNAGRLHTSGGERHHRGNVRAQSLLFDDLSIFSHRHLVQTGIAAVTDRNELPITGQPEAEPDKADMNTEVPEDMAETAQSGQGTEELTGINVTTSTQDN